MPYWEANRGDSDYPCGGGGKNGLGLVFDALRDSDLPVWHFRPTHVGKLGGQQAVDLAKMGAV